MALIFHSNLSKDLYSILNNADDFNVIIQVGENQNVKEFHAHSVILRARCSYFKSALSTDWIIKKNNMIIFNKPNITPTVFEMILKYIYTGELDLTKQSGEDVLGLLVASDELLLEELFNYAQDYLIDEKQQSWVQQNFVFILHYIFKLTSCKRLHDYCLESICEDPQSFITSKNFLSLDQDILYELFKRNDLQIEEVVAWDSLIKWGIEQTPSLGSDRTKWNVRDYEALKRTLSPFIPLIRFVELSPADYFDKVRPYKDVIPDHICEEVEEFYYKGTLPKTTTLPPRARKIESNIIGPKLANIIASWIEKRNAPLTQKDPTYKFNLIYRGSCDGINNRSFRIKCNGQVASLVLIKVQQSDKIFGGYSSIGFNSIGYNCLRVDDHGWKWYHSSDNFIFSFEHSKDTKNMKISRVVNNSKAILDYDGNGFNFGQGSLSMRDQILSVYSECRNYENNLNTGYSVYIIEEIETFIVSSNFNYQYLIDQ